MVAYYCYYRLMGMKTISPSLAYTYPLLTFIWLYYTITFTTNLILTVINYEYHASKTLNLL
jgi:hypothetical protein